MPYGRHEGLRECACCSRPLWVTEDEFGHVAKTISHMDTIKRALMEVQESGLNTLIGVLDRFNACHNYLTEAWQGLSIQLDEPLVDVRD